MEQSLTPEVIREQIAETTRRMEAAQSTVEDCKAFLMDLIAASRALGRITGTSPLDEPTPVVAEQKDGPPYKDGTNKAFIYRAMLESAPVWVTANQVQEWASTLKGADIPMSSVSPTLSDLKSEGVIIRDGMKVALTSRSEGLRTEHVAQPGMLTLRQVADGNLGGIATAQYKLEATPM